MGMKRRTFLQLLAGGAVGTLATPIIWQGIDDTAIWTQNFPWIPRIPKGPVEYKTVISKFCSSFSGSKIGMVGENPVCVSANEDNPFSMGGLSSFAGTEVQMLYSPSRIRTPMARTAKNELMPISWEEAFDIIAEKMQGAGNSVAMISGDDTSSVNEIFSALIGEKGSANYFFMPSERQPAQIAWKMLGGEGILAYQYDKSNMVIALGANVVDTFGLPVRFIKLREKTEAKLLYIGSYASNTFTVADDKYMIIPGSEVIFMLGVISALLKQGYTLPNVEGIEDLPVLLQKFPHAEVLQETGIKKEVFDAFMEQIISAHSPLFIAGSPMGSGTPVALVMLSILATQMLAKEGSHPIATVPFPTRTVEKSLQYSTILGNDCFSYLHGLSKEAPLACMITYQANPLYSLPNPQYIKKQWGTISFKVAISSFMDETTAESDIILPLTLSIEGVDDAYTPYGSDKEFYLQTTPCIAPVCNAKTGAEIALLLASSLGVSVGIDSTKDFFAKKLSSYTAHSLENIAGVYVGESQSVPLPSRFDAKAITTFFTAMLRPTLPTTGRKDITLVPYAQLYMGTATTSVPPFAVKNIPHTSFKNKDMYVTMNAKTAGKTLKTGDTVNISNGANSIKAKVYIHESVVDNTVAVLAGLGHTAFDAFTKNKGINPMQVLSVENVDDPLLCSWSRNIVEIRKV